LDLLTAIEPLNHNQPKEIILHQNYPNPFNPSTKINYSVEGKRYKIRISAYNVLGQEVTVLVNKEHDPGDYETTFDGNNLPGGLYIIKLQYGDYIKTIKSLLIK